MKNRILLLAVGLAVTMALVSANMKADSTLHIGPGAGTACATGCAGDPNVLGGALKGDISQTSGGAPTLSDPILLILAVPNDTTNLFASVPASGLSGINAYPGGSVTPGTAAFATAGTYGLITPVVDGFFGTMTSGEVYSFLGLSGGNNSNNFGNLATADLSVNGITASNFGIYVLALNADLGAQGLLDFSISAALPNGSYALAYGEGSSGEGKHKKVTIFDTPFTESGLKDGGTTPTPEPASMLLLGSGLLSLGGVLRRRLKI